MEGELLLCVCECLLHSPLLIKFTFSFFARMVNSSLIVVTLNTINLAWGEDCDKHGSASLLQMKWLQAVIDDVQLKNNNSNNNNNKINIWIMGHVPPSLFMKECRKMYATMSLAGGVVTHIYGHQHSGILSLARVLFVFGLLFFLVLYIILAQSRSNSLYLFAQWTRGHKFHELH
jgi:hypothetical protein